MKLRNVAVTPSMLFCRSLHMSNKQTAVFKNNLFYPDLPLYFMAGADILRIVIMIPPEKNSLLPSLNLMDATLLVIGAVIGSGIFLTSGLIASSLPSVGWIITVWLFGAVISLFGGLTFAELGAMLPEAGGQYLSFTGGLRSPGWLYVWLDGFYYNANRRNCCAGSGLRRIPGLFFPVSGIGSIPLGDENVFSFLPVS